MTPNKKERNTQIPIEAIKGAAEKEANFMVAGISCEKMKESQRKQSEKTKDTNHVSYESIKPEELDIGVAIKAYNNTSKKQENDRDK
jgi:hypothetical protein